MRHERTGDFVTEQPEDGPWEDGTIHHHRRDMNEIRPPMCAKVFADEDALRGEK